MELLGSPTTAEKVEQKGIQVAAGQIPERLDLTVSAVEEKVSRFEEKLQDLERQFDLLNVEIEEWRAKYAHLEVEKERLFQELQKELAEKEGRSTKGRK